MGAVELQVPDVWQVVVAVPLKVYPSLQLYVDAVTVVPVVGDTAPNVGLDNVVVH